MDKLKLLTFNAKGLKDDDKRQNVFHWLKSKNIDIMYIQEAHCEADTIKKWEDEWGGKSWPVSAQIIAEGYVFYSVQTGP